MHHSTTRPARSRWVRLAAATAALVLTAAACGGDDDDDSASDGSAATSGESAATATTAAGSDESVTSTPADGTSSEGTAAASGGAANSGGTLRYAYPIGPSRFDPHRSTVGQDIRIFTMVYDRLVHYDSTGALVPGLAKSWEFSDDGLQLTLVLQDGVTFHDGAAFDADAVKANLERGQTVEGSAVVADLASITAVEVVDPMTVVLTLSAPNSALPGILSSRAGVMVSPAAFGEGLDLAPVGAGPYRVTDYRPDDVIIFERFEDYWDPTYGGPDRVEWRIMADETTRLNALQAGEVDAALITGAQQEQAEQGGFTVDARPTLSYQTIYLNRARSEFGDVRVRQAMSHAINREAFVESVLSGAGEPTVQDFPEGYFAHNPDYPGDYYEYDPEKARELLAEAGLADGFSFEMMVPNLSTFTLGAQVTQQMFAEVGLTVTLRTIEAAQAGDLMFAQDDSDSMIAQFGGRSDPQITMDLQYSPEGFLNAGDNTTDEYMELSEAAKAAREPAEREEALQAMSGEVAKNAFTLPIAHDFNINAYTDQVEGFNLLAGGEMDVRNMSVGAG